MQPDEVRALPREELRLIVLMEARAAPRLHTVEGLWRRSTRTGSRSMTAFIRQEGLLDPAEVETIIADAPADLLEFQRVAAAIPLAERPTMGDWLARFNAGFDNLTA